MDWWTGPAADYELTQAALLAAGITDGLPVLPPTRDRVERMLAAAGCDAQATLGILPPTYVDLCWNDVAINAVMAGCSAACLPIVGAAMAAMCAPEFNLLGIATTTGSACPLIIVNGPVAAAAGMNAGANALGPGNRANASIGRAVALVLRNVGGAIPGEVDMATLGQPGKYSFCLAENESQSPWPPLHVERGYDAAQSVVTVVGVSGSNEVVDSVSMSGVDLARTMAGSMLSAGNVGSTGTVGGGNPVLLVPPEHAELFRRDGLDKARVQQLVHHHARLPVDWLSPAMRASVSRKEQVASSETLSLCERAEDILLVVCGGVGRKATFIPSWSGPTCAVSRVVSPE